MGQTSHKALRDNLIEYYREEESTMPVAPLAEQHEDKLTRFYVRPPMLAYRKPNAFGQKEQSEEQKKTKIESYRELLLNGNNPYRRIYVTADAGMGKTSFAKMLAVTWCEAHDPQKQPIKDVIISKLSTRQTRSPQRNNIFSFNTDDLSAMKTFDFLFLIKLRKFESSALCSLDEMVLVMLKSKLPNKVRYTEQFLENILCNKQCLIIVDGLDEWIHPQSCGRKELIPHRRHWPRCTVLTTTRPWKLSTSRLSKSDIDRHVELSKLDETTAQELESKAIEFLNENQRQIKQVEANSNTKTVTDFRETVPVKLLPQIRHIPFVLLQMICLWFENCLIGCSLCEVYSNIIELNLSRWLNKKDHEHTNCNCKPSEEHENIEIKCMRKNTHCRCYMPLLSKIGELAFSTLFSVIQEKSLLFDRKQVLNYLDEVELDQCLKIGLLSQVKDSTSVVQVLMQFYFPHKTFHEFFCALFMATNWNETETKRVFIKDRLLDKCKSVSDILEMTNVFVFVFGVNPEVYSDISRHLSTVVDKDQRVINYRYSVERYVLSAYDVPWELRGYQNMQISSFLESTRNEHPECRIVLKDIMLDEWMEKDELLALVEILSNNTRDMKSLVLYDFQDRDSLSHINQILEKSECSCLETLRIFSSGKPSVIPFLPKVLTTAANTLKYLCLYQLIVSANIASAVSRLSNLRGLRLSHAVVTEDSLHGINKCIGNCILLQQLYLTKMEYRFKSTEKKKTLVYLRRDQNFEFDPDNDAKRHSYVLDLSQHSQLQKLELEFPLAELHINPKNLADCKVRNRGIFSKHAVSSLLAELHGAPILETFGLIHILNPFSRTDITDLQQVTEFNPSLCDLRGSTLTLTLPQVTNFTVRVCDLRESTVTLTQPQITEFTLEDCDLRESILNLTLPQVKTFILTKCDVKGSTLTLTLPQVRELILRECDFRVSTLTLSQNMISLENIELDLTTLSIPCCRKLFLSISQLQIQQTVTVKLCRIYMTEGQWRELLFDILGSLSKFIQVDMFKCQGPSEKEWKDIVHGLEAQPESFYFRHAHVYPGLVAAEIKFDTVGEWRKPLVQYIEEH